MANIKSQKKRVLTNEKSHKRNVAVKSGLKTAIRATRKAIEAGDKAAAEAKIAELKTAMQGTDTEAIKTKLDELQKAFYEISEKLYKAAAEAQAAQQGPAAGDNAGAGQNADYVDTDYKDVDENGNK